MTKEALSELALRIQQGDREVFTQFYEATYPSARYHAQAILRQEQDVEDAVQEAYLQAYAHIKDLRVPEAASAWLSQIVTYTCMHKLRGQRGKDALSLDDEDFNYEPIAGSEDMPESRLDRWGTKEILNRIIDQLPTTQRTVVILFYYDELRVSRIAALMGCSENTVKSRLNYARQNIEAALREEERQGIKLYSVTPALIAAAIRRRIEAMPAAPGLPPVSPSGSRPQPPRSSSHASRSGDPPRTARASSHRRVKRPAPDAAVRKAAHTAVRSAGHSGKTAAAVTAVKAGAAARLAAGIAAATLLIGAVGTGIAIKTGVFSPEEKAEPTPAPAVETMPIYREKEDVAEAPVTPRPENSASPEPTAPEPLPAMTREEYLSVYHAFVRQGDFDSDSRFLLRDVDGDGLEELLAVHQTVLDDGLPWGLANIYTVLNGQVVSVEENGGGIPEAGGNAIVLLTLRGKEYLAMIYSNTAWNQSWSTAVLRERDDPSVRHLVETSVTYDPETFSSETAVKSAAMDGAALDYEEWINARRDGTVLLISFGEEGLTLGEFLQETAPPRDEAETTESTVSIQNGDAFRDAYASVFQSYHTYLAADAETRVDLADSGYLRPPEEPGVAFLCQYCENPGYCFLDLDEDGTPELLVSSHDSKYYADQILELYTLKDGVPYRVLYGYERSNYYLCPDGRIANPGSSGASSDMCSLYRLNGIRLETVTTYIHENNEYYQFDGERPYPYTKQPGDLTLTREGYEEAISEIRSGRLVPELSPFA